MGYLKIHIKDTGMPVRHQWIGTTRFYNNTPLSKHSFKSFQYCFNMPCYRTRLFLLEVVCTNENRAILFIDFVLYEPFRRLMYSRSMPGYEPHGHLIWGTEFISQAHQGYPAKHPFFVGFRSNSRHFGNIVPTFKHREWNQCVSWVWYSIVSQFHTKFCSLVQCKLSCG